MRIDSAKELHVYQRAYALAMQIFRFTQRFPADERFAITSQIRRSSRSVCLNLREGWAKRRYEGAFVHKLTDSDAENSETQSSLDFARDCGYISAEEHRDAIAESEEIGKMLGAMIQNPSKFLIKPQRKGSTVPVTDFRLPTSDFRPLTSDL